MLRALGLFEQEDIVRNVYICCLNRILFALFMKRKKLERNFIQKLDLRRKVTNRHAKVARILLILFKAKCIISRRVYIPWTSKHFFQFATISLWTLQNFLKKDMHICLINLESYHNIDIFMEILAGCRECLRRCIFKVPKLVLHATIEFVRILLPFQMEFHANCCILGKIKRKKKRLYKVNRERTNIRKKFRPIGKIWEIAEMENGNRFQYQNFSTVRQYLKDISYCSLLIEHSGHEIFL